jgi:hypothetical protein
MPAITRLAPPQKPKPHAARSYTSWSKLFADRNLMLLTFS